MADLITTQEAAEVLGVTQRRVQAMIKAGQLRAQLFGSARLLLIERTDLQAVMIRPKGRPPKTPAEPVKAVKPSPAAPGDRKASRARKAAKVKK